MNPEEIPLNANIFSITDLPLPLTMLPARDRITGQIKRTALPRRVKGKRQTEYAGMVELVDSVDLGSTARACRFESCCPHQQKKNLCLPRQRFFF